ncbi:hypothetical protein LOTGIDRAFT_236465 [Lottia gigantea]|uniref:non-specific serine/threonine protein kinase n=1 Tax=Lottia gigantea TaxID=225164 RepID=V3ZRT9_LOTGI|nr:hypothetical protein LOTGIDRAFT_236465 [Lottia gigantea]ESO83601.1 hypothetical protein LOTGIDRAFT_236465 [Lottia gigantea]
MTSSRLNIKPFERMWDKVKITRKLGSGGFGTVYLMEIGNDIYHYIYQLAVKEIKYSDHVDGMRMMKEIEIMKNLNHGNVARKPSNYLTESEAVKFASQIASAIMYLHQNNIIHRDIKPENILLTMDQNVKLADYGISKQVENSVVAVKTQCGTLFYMAPEILNSLPYSYKADCWSFGCVLYELMTLQYAFGVIFLGKFNPLPFLGIYNKDLHNLVHGLLTSDVNQRFNMDNVLYVLQKMGTIVPQNLLLAPVILNLPSDIGVMEALKNFKMEQYLKVNQ